MKAWLIMKKDFEEFKQNKMIISSLAVFPLLLAVIVPIATLLPLSYAIEEEEKKIIYEEDIAYPSTNETIIGEISGMVENKTIRSGKVSSAIVKGSIIEKDVKVENSILISCVVNGSVENSTLVNSIINTKRVLNVNIVDSKFVRSSPGLEELNFAFDISFSMVLIFFILIPMIIPTLVASYSIVGEKNNRSLEPLLATPISGRELLLGKIFAIFVPSLFVTYASFGLFVVIVAAVFPQILYRIFTAEWLIALGLIVPLASLMSIETNVFISTRYSDVRVAQQMGGLGTLPVFLLFVPLLSGIVQVALFLGVFAFAVALVDVGIFVITDKLFDRESILLRWK